MEMKQEIVVMNIQYSVKIQNVDGEKRGFDLAAGCRSRGPERRER